MWEKVFSRLKILFVSHMHADHHIGVLRVLLEREKVRFVHVKYETRSVS